MDQQERRRYFRINDYMSIRYRVLNEAEAADCAEDFSHAAYRQSTNKDDVEVDLALIFDRLRIRHPDIVSALELLNKKIDGQAMQEVADSGALEPGEVVSGEASISACGVAFMVEDACKRGAILQMEVTLRPSQLVIHSLGEVVACDQLEAKEGDVGSHLLRVNYLNMSEQHQEVLVQHIIRRQGIMLKVRRESTQG